MLMMLPERRRIMAFAETEAKPQVLKSAIRAKPSPARANSRAERLLNTAGVREGYALWFGVDDDQLLKAVVAQSQLHVVAVERDDWKVASLRERLDRAGQVYASPILADGRLYYLTRGGRMFVVAAKPEFELLAVNELDDRSRFDASPAVDGNRLLIRSDKFLYCVGE